MKIKTGDKVKILTGADKGKEGKVNKILGDKVIIEGINMIKKHLKPKNNNGTGEIIDTEAPIHISNVKLIEVKKEVKKETKKEVKKVTKSKKENN